MDTVLHGPNFSVEWSRFGEHLVRTEGRKSSSRSNKEVKKTDETWYHTDVNKQQVVVWASREVSTGKEGFGQTSGTKS